MVRRRLFERLIVILIALSFQTWALGPVEAWAQTSAQTVRLIIDYGDGSLKLYADIPWQSGQTVLEAMKVAQTRVTGLDFTDTGGGATAFLAAIDGVRNQGGGAGKRNWQYWVNTAYADKSFAIQTLQALDTVTWQFGFYQGK